MSYSVDDLYNNDNFRQIKIIPYSGIIDFIFSYLKKITPVNLLFFVICLLFLLLSTYLKAYTIDGTNTFIHWLLGFVILPLLSIPFHEILHIIPYYLMGARNMRVGMDLKQLLVYVTAHRQVASPGQFIIVALVPFLTISIILIAMIVILPGNWKWSLSTFMFVHATMCAGDIALLNFYYVNRDKKIYTWDDADEKIAYFYEKILKN
jgi:uncharacterized membrane protein